MPVKSYLLQPVRGMDDELKSALSPLGGCELIETTRPDLYVLLTDTSSREEEKKLETALETLPGVACLSLVSAYDDREIEI